MTQRSLSQQAYCQAVGSSPTGSAIIEQRDPTANDIYYPIGQFWINQAALRLWYLNTQSNASGVLQSTWEIISVAGDLATLSGDVITAVAVPSLATDNPPFNIQLLGGTGISVTLTGTSQLTIASTGAGNETLTGDDGVAVSPILGTIQTLGNTVANSTHAKPLFTTNPSTNIERFDIQVAAAVASTNINKTGIAAFSNTQFAVDANGFVTLSGGSGAPTLGLVPDAHTAPGTTPVVPNGSGNIILEGGATFATGTQANPIRTNSLAANTIDLQIQLAGANAATSTPNDFGVAQFDSNSFGVSSGFVTLKNGGTTGAVTAVQGDDSLSVVPSSGIITLDGVTVLNATNAKPVYFKKNATSVEELDVQLATTSTSGAKNINKSGLAHFDSASFTIDSATGFVSLAAGSVAVETLTGNTGGAISPVAGNINTVGTGSITIAGSGNTLTTQLTGLTNHAVQVGAGTATLTQVSPSATSGVPLISQGSSADPVFGTAVVAGGGTGDTSFTAYAVICGGTTSTGNLQNVSGVGTSGQVLTSTGAGSLPTWQSVGVNNLQINMDAGTSPISPTADVLTFTGAQVATGVVGTNVIRTDGSAANAMTIQIQRTTTSAVSNVALNGVSHFDSSKFSVDANGFVTFTGSTSNMPWTDQGGNFSAASNNGYFCTAVLNATLPPTPAQGDLIRFVVDTSSVVTIVANTGQKIRLGNVITALVGSCGSTKQGDSINLVYRASSATWYAISSTGSWGLT